jgi:hypothetical protein
MPSVVRGFALGLGLMAAAIAGAQEPVMTWPEAVEILTREREAGVDCVRIVKRVLPASDEAALGRTELDYVAARSDFNSLIGRLQAGLANAQETLALTEIEATLRSGSEARDALCERARRLVPAEAGEKGIGEAVAATIGELADAGAAIFIRLRDDDKERRRSLSSALDNAKWPPFSEIEG